jgi:uncharacterized protein
MGRPDPENTVQAAELSPEDYRRRYFALKETGQKRVSTALRRLGNPRDLPEEWVAFRETLPPGWYWTRRLARGQTLRILNGRGAASVAALFWNADEPSERLNPADTIKVQWTARIGAGRILLSDMGRAMASITDDTNGFHDCLAGGSTAASNVRKYGAAGAHRNSHDNFVLAAGKHGLSVRDVGPCISFFAPVVTDDAGRLTWRGNACRPGDYIDLRAEMNLIVALSNCPHPLDPETQGPSAPVALAVWQGEFSPNEGDYCRNVTDEARRAFENTDALLAQGGAS